MFSAAVLQKNLEFVIISWRNTFNLNSFLYLDKKLYYNQYTVEFFNFIVPDGYYIEADFNRLNQDAVSALHYFHIVTLIYF